MIKLHYNFKDIFRAARFGFSAKKMWIISLGILIGIIGYLILAYVAFLVGADYGFRDIWDQFKFIPSPFGIDFTWYGWVIMAVAIIWLVAVNLITLTAASKVTYEQLKGDEFFEIKESYKYAKSNWKGILLSPLTLAGFVILLVIFGIIFGLIGKIPYFGELFIGIFAIPIFAVSLFVIYLIVVFFVAFFLAPAIVATTKSDTFDTMFELFSCVNEQPWRFVAYQGLLVFTINVAWWVLALFTKYAVSLAEWAIGLLMGDKLFDCLNNAYCYLPNLPQHPYIANVWTFLFPRLAEGRFPVEMKWSGDITAVLFAIVLYIIFFFLISFKLSIFAAGQTLIYINLVKRKDEKDLLEKKEEEIFEEEKKAPVSKKKAPAKKKAPKEKVTKKKK